MKFKVSDQSVPAGNYRAKFVGVESTVHDKFGAGLRWRFEILAGAQTGRIASRITGTTPSPMNACGSIISGLRGQQVTDGDEFDAQSYLGQSYIIIVTAGTNGWSRVESLLPLPDDQAAS